MFQTIYLRKWTDNFTSSEIGDIAIIQWRKGLEGIDNASIEHGVDYCRTNLEWPPSIAEFIGICEKQNGRPSWEDTMNLAIRGDFSHPLTKMVYDKIGSWSFRNDSDKDLRAKVKTAYSECAHLARMKLIEG